MQDKQNIAVFVDYDNIEIGVKSTLRREFDVSLPLEALKERGDVVAKFAYILKLSLRSVFSRSTLGAEMGLDLISPLAILAVGSAFSSFAWRTSSST